VTEIDKNSDEFKQAVADIVDEAVAGLKAKNAELIARNKKLQAGATVDPAEFSALEAERDDWKAKANEAAKALGKAQKLADEATKRAADIDASYGNAMRDAQLTEALSKAGVTPALLKAAKARLSPELQVVDENGTRVVKAGDKSVFDHITEWAGSEEGKHFIAAPDTRGGGAHGARPDKNATSVSRAAFEGMSTDQRMAHIKSNGVVTDA
jgi:hypothetical protein